jgi:glycerol uptake facilitator-like aquaporin
MASQMIGGVIASAVVFASLGDALMRKDGGKMTAETVAGFGDVLNADYVDSVGCFAIEALGTGIMMFMILALTDERNPLRPDAGMIPFFVGMTVTVLISIFGPLTMAGWNPARDVPPRVIALMVGYGEMAFPGPHGGVWAYTLGPCFGAVTGGFFYEYLIAPGLPPAEVSEKESEAEKVEAALPNLLEMREIVAKQVVSEPTCDVVVPSAEKGDSMC